MIIKKKKLSDNSLNLYFFIINYLILRQRVSSIFLS